MPGDSKTITFDQIKFLVERAHAEASLFWVRNNVFLVVNVTALGAAFAYITKTDEIIEFPERIALLVFGILNSLLWDLVTQRGRKMNHVWISSAGALAEKEVELFPVELINAINQTPMDSVTKTPIQIKGATSLIRPFIILFSGAWITVCLLLGNGSLVNYFDMFN